MQFQLNEQLNEQLKTHFQFPTAGATQLCTTLLSNQLVFKFHYKGIWLWGIRLWYQIVQLFACGSFVTWDSGLGPVCFESISKIINWCQTCNTPIHSIAASHHLTIRFRAISSHQELSQYLCTLPRRERLVPAMLATPPMCFRIGTCCLVCELVSVLSRCFREHTYM